jgi:hypothetical protein
MEEATSEIKKVVLTELRVNNFVSGKEGKAF